VGITPYIDERDNELGRYHAPAIREAIRRSAAVLVLLTEAAYNSRYVSHEIGAAVQEGRLVVALVDPILQGRDFAMLEGVQVLWFDYQDPVPSIPALSAALTRIVSTAANTREAVTSSTSQSQSIQMSWSFDAQLNLTPGQALFGIVVVALIIGGLIWAAQNGGAPTGI
jgi:hypothetical protein